MSFSTDLFSKHAKILINDIDHARAVLVRLFELGCGFDRDFHCDYSGTNLANVHGISVDRAGHISYWFRGMDEAYFQDSAEPFVTLDELQAADPKAVLAHLNEARRERRHRAEVRDMLFRVGRLDPRDLTDEQVECLRKLLEPQQKES